MKKMTIAIMVTLFMVLSVFVQMNGSDQIPEKIYAGNVFDNAEDWAPLKILNPEPYKYYKITIDKKQILKMHMEYIDIYYHSLEGGVIIYNSDASPVTQKQKCEWDLDVGTYYAYFDNDYLYGSVWYNLSNGGDKTDLTIISNLNGTLFEKAIEWDPLTTITDNTFDKYKERDLEQWECLKINLYKRCKIEFRCDNCWGDYWGNEYLLYDSNGLLITDMRMIKGFSINLDKGIYFIRIIHEYTNLYYVLTPSDQATGISIDKKSLNMTIAQEAILSYSLEPSDCVDTVNWTSGDTSIATVDDGKVTATGTGQCLINATTTSGKVASCVVTVIKPTFTITLKDGDSVIETKKLEMDKTYGSLPQLKKKGYLFTGWFADKNGKEEVSSGTTAKKNTTIYAGWEKVTVEKPVIRYKTSKAKSITVDWNLVYGVKGYELRYSTKSNMKKAKKISVSVNQKTIKKLKTKKKYYLQVRAYKMDSTGEKVYSAWSKKENIKTKK